MSATIGKLALVLTANSQAFNKDLERASSKVDAFGGDVRRKFQKMSDETARMKLMSAPFNVNRQAALELQQHQAKGAYDSALNMARARVGMGRFGQLGAKLAGSSGQAAGAALDTSVAGVGALLSRLGMLGPVGIAAAAAVGGVGAAFIGLKKGLDLAKFANPAAAQRNQRAWDDLYAVIGQRFVPLLDRVTSVTRIFGDFLQTVLPSSGEVESMFKELDPVIQEFRTALADLSPVVKMVLIEHIKVAAVAMKAFAISLNALLDTARMMPFGKALFGEKGSGGDMLSSVNAAPRQAQFVGLEELSRRNIQAGFSQGTDPAREMVNKQGETNGLIQQTNELLRGFGSGLAGGVALAIRGY